MAPSALPAFVLGLVVAPWVVRAGVSQELEGLPGDAPPRRPMDPRQVSSHTRLFDADNTEAFSMKGYGNVRWDVAALDAVGHTAAHGGVHAAALAAAARTRNPIQPGAEASVLCAFQVVYARAVTLMYSTDGVETSVLYVDRGVNASGDPITDTLTLNLGRVHAVMVEETDAVCSASLDATDAASGMPSDTPASVLRVHSLVVGEGVHGDVAVQAHTIREVSAHTLDASPAEAVSKESVIVDAAGGATPVPARPRLRFMSYNVWNVNPPKWLWRDKRDRFRQYTLRMLHLADVVHEVSPDIIAFQEVRYDTSLGGWDDPAHEADPYPAQNRYSQPYTYRYAYLVATDWYNRTRRFAVHDKYLERNAAKWDAVRGAAHFRELVECHGVEGPRGVIAQRLNTSEEQDLAALPGPYKRGAGVGPASFAAHDAAFRKHPHAQIQHLAGSLPGFQYVYQPAQLYVDPSAWSAAPHRDEEGPAIFSRFPITHSDYILLSRDPNDEGDGHQRLCLHAVIDTGASRAGLVDVYTVHLPLSEAARDRIVPELLAFVHDSARGNVQIVAGDMNAEPHERAMRFLREAGVVVESAAPTDTDGELDHEWSAYLQAAMARYHAARQAADAARLAPSPALADAWLLLHDEPQQRDGDAARRRYALTFPSDDPIKRIDMVMLAGKAGSACAPEKKDRPDCVADVHEVYLVGQDPLPATDLSEGKGFGMTHESSPMYASDHRAVVTEFSLRAR